ncbi:MAG: hypothetical protein ABW252_17220 [Polyangiales bacterium]
MPAYDHELLRYVALAGLLWGGAAGSASSQDAPGRDVAADERRADEALERAFAALPPETFCDANWCSVDSRVGQVDVSAIGGTSPDDVWFAAGGKVFHWDGATTRVIEGQGAVQHIEAAARDDVWLASYGQVSHWDGHAFARYAVQGVRALVRGASGQVLVHTTNAVHAWTGSGFREVTRREDANGMAGTELDDLWAYNARGLWHYDGAEWSEAEALRGQFVTAVTSFGPSDVWAVFGKPGAYNIVSFDGEAWTPRLPVKGSISKIVGTSASDLWFFGYEMSAHFDGQRLETLDRIWFSRGDGRIGEVRYLFGGSDESVYRMSTQPRARLVNITEPTPQMNAVWASSRTDVWAAGAKGAAWNFDGKTLTPIATGVTVPLHDVGGTAPDDVWMVGGRGVVLHGSRSGGLRVIPSGVTADLYSVFADARGQAWIGGRGVLLRATPTGIVPMTPPWSVGPDGREMTIMDMHGTAPDDLWAVADRGVSHFDGKTWSPPDRWLDSTSWGGPDRIWAVRRDDVWAATASGCGHGTCNMWHWDGTRWTGGRITPPREAWMFTIGHDAIGGGVNIWALSPAERWAVYGGKVSRALR